MSGVRRCKEFLRNLNQEELKITRVLIKRRNIPDLGNDIHRIYRELDDPKSLVIHFNKEISRGIFDREDIVVNQEFPEETFKNSSRSRSRRSPSVEDSRREEKSRNVSYYHESSSKRRNQGERSYRSRSRSGDGSRRDRSRSGSYRKRSRSPSRRDKYNGRSRRGERKKSRSFSPHKKKPGLFIPTESDNLKHQRRKAGRSHSPSSSHGPNKIREHSGRSSMERHRSPRKRSRSPSRSRRSRSGSTRARRSRRSRSRSRHFEREIEYVGLYGDPQMPPCIFQDGKYWIPVGPAFLPRGFIPPPLYPRPFPPPMMMPRMPNMMQPYRQRPHRPRQQQSAPCDVASTSTAVKNAGGGSNEENKQQNT
ncbi:serine/arginine repetitive matrix protein 2-like [Coccinella septempunctata]|uniref:serine/arginine repetitive matrix protein 2-like n=1 Tax=Coccinella septempunctata TaxID=41139 RepID=UPI001D069247|nr:serine/arginine repetitive matrix protein 2-like [Coccinella septempunctata]